MKRYLFLLALLLNGVWASAQFSGSGTGTSNDPYIITNPIQLNQIRGFLNTSGVYFKLMQDIDLTDWIADNNPTQGWQPIGTSSSPFKGVLDGNNHTISGFVVNRSTTDYVGFFANLASATIKDLTIKGTVAGKDYTGGISGTSNSSTFTNVTFIGNITGQQRLGGISGHSDGGTYTNCYYEGGLSSSNNNVGGINGYKTGTTTYTSCKVNSTITAAGENVGGIVGYGDSGSTTNITSCFTYGTISGSKYVGGLAGHINVHTLSESGAIMNLNSTNGYVGGIIGSSDQMYIRNGGIQRKVIHCFCIGDIHSEGDNVGGIIGYDYGYYYYNSSSYYFYYSSSSISNSYYSGNIYGKNNIGGIVGYAHQSQINKCYAVGSISGNQNVGGIAGYMCERSSNYRPNISSCVSIHDAINAVTSDVGRIYGKKDAGNIGQTGSQTGNLGLGTCRVVKNGVLQTIEDGEQNGTSTGRSTLKVRGTYQAIGWNFNDDWNILDTECYPYAKTQMAPPIIESGCFTGSTSVSGKSVNGGTVYLTTNGKTYKTTVSNNHWTITTSPLQGGVKVEVYADDDSQIQSYVVSQEISYKGKGTYDDPYQIYTAADLANAGGNHYYKLMNDIDLTQYIKTNSPTAGWIPIGKGGSVMAQFDGCGFTVSGLWINSSEDYVGLFSNASGTTIKNLTVITASGKKVKGGNYTGGIIGRNYNSTIENCYFKGDVEGLNYTGGITGADESSQNTLNRASGNVTGTVNVGGIAGSTSGSVVTKAQFSGNVNSTGASSCIGGIAGLSSSDVSVCTSSGLVTATGSGSVAGGVIGQIALGGSLKDSYSNADISTTSYVGGIAGYSYGSIYGCYAVGNLNSKADFGGGIVGYNDGTAATVKRCVAINSLINIDDQQGWASRVVGGIKNDAPAPEMSNYAYKEMVISVNGEAKKLYDDIMNGTSKTLDALKQQDTYEILDWDFTNTWGIEEGSGYPYLKNIGKAIDDDPVNPDEPLPDNVIYADNTDVQPGGQMVLPVKMKSAEAITGYQFDLVLPDGFSVAEEDGDYLIDLASRTTYKKHSISYQDQADGSIRIVCTSLNNATFAELDGVVTNITLNVDESVEAGDYNIIYKNIELATPALNKYKVAKWSSKVTVFDYILGDVNNDKDVSVVDAAATVNLILGVNTAGLNRKAADIDADGEISVTDAAGVVNIILGQGASVKSAPAKTRLTATADNTLALSDFTAEAGTQQTISVGMNNTASITGIQFDLVLPEGVTVAQEDGDYLIDISTDRTTYKNHSASYQMQADGSMRVVCTSLSNKTFKENSGNVIDITLDIASSISGGSHTITLKNIELATPELEKYKPSAVSATMTVSGGAYNYIAVDNGGNNVNKSVASGDDVTINDTYQSLSVTEDIDNVNVSYSRTYKNTSWQAWYVPFGFTLTSDIASRFSFAKFAGTYTEAGQFFITLVEMQEGDEIKSNVPYFVQAKVADSSNPQVLTISNTTLYATDASGFKMLSAEKEIAIYGTYAKKVAAADDDWYAYGGGKYIKATTGQSLGAFRFYLTIRDREDNPYASTPNPIEIKVVVLGDEADGISSLNGNDSENGTMFNLAGQPVGTDYKGVVIRNGKKVLIK